MYRFAVIVHNVDAPQSAMAPLFLLFNQFSLLGGCQTNVQISRRYVHLRAVSFADDLIEFRFKFSDNR